MKRLFAAAVVLGVLIYALALPMAALAFQVTGGGGTQTQNPYGLWYAGQEACAQEGCHSKIAAQPSPHGRMVTDVNANPSKLVPAADSPLWPYSSPLGGAVIRPRDVYLVTGDPQGFHEYIGPAGSMLASTTLPADDLVVWDPMIFLLEQNVFTVPTAKVGSRAYSQSCSACHNLGVTRPSSTVAAMPGGGMQTSATPSSVSAFGIQCEVCHGTGKNPSGHKNGVPGVVGGYQVLKAQVCGQCHVTGTTPQKNVAGAAFGNPNGYTTDATLSAFLTPYTAVESEKTFMSYVASGGPKPKFLPNGANFSMRHSYYNEWLGNLVPSAYGGNHGHTDPVNEAVKTYAAAGAKCFRCHSGLGFLNRIDAKAPTGTRIVPTYPTPSEVASADPGISCQVCHGGHIGYNEGANAGYDSLRRWGNGKEVSCGDCHNWQFELLDTPIQHETIAGREFTRPAVNAASMHPQREMVTGGAGGEDGLGGLWGVAPMGSSMPGVTCKDCHMPRTHREDMPANDDGSTAETRMSHRFHVTLPGDAQRWNLRKNGDSCSAGCHKEDAAGYSRADFQNWIDQQRTAVSSASVAATATLGALASDLGLASWKSFLSAQPTTGTAGSLPAARWAMVQRSAQNADFVANDGSGGAHNPAYALAGLAKARLWAQSAVVSLDATLGAGPAVGEGMTASGSLLGVGGSVISGAQVVLETSTDGGSTWAIVTTGRPNPSGAFSLSTGRIVGNRDFRVRFTPMEGVDYVSALMPVAVPVTAAGVTPAGATSSWFNIASAQVTLNATPGSLTFYSLSGATVRSQTLYTGPIGITSEGRTAVAFWSTNGSAAEANQTLSVLIDRAAPVVRSDLDSVYANKAVIHAWGTDAGAGVASMRYTFRGTTKEIAGSSFSFGTYALGKNNLVVRIADRAGKTSTKTLSVWVRATPRLSMSPGVRKTISKGTGIKFATRATRGHDSAGHDIMLTGRPLVLQRWDGRKWMSWKSFSNRSGSLSWTRKFTAKGTTYWRWRVNSDQYSYPANSATLKVVVK